MARVLAALLLALLPLPQEFDKAKKELSDAVGKLDEFDAGRAADALVKADSKEAVDVLLDAIGKLAARLKPLWTEKERWLREMDANSDFEMKDPTHVSNSGLVKHGKFRAAEEEAKKVENSILSLEGVKRRIVKAFGAFSSEAAFKHLSAKLDGAREWPRRAAIAEGLGAGTSPLAGPVLLRQLAADKEAGVQVACLDALRARGDKGPEVVAAVCASLSTEFWQVKVAAGQLLRALGPVEARSAVQPLIEALQGADGRLKHELNGVLVHFTGADRHGEVDAWRAWWTQNGEAWLAGTYKPSPADAAAAAGGTQTTFYGIPVLSKNVIFIVDRSGSMMEPSQWEVEEGPDTATGGGSKNPADAAPKKEGDKKIDIAKWQLKRCLFFLPEGTEFNVIFFNHEVTAYSDKMVKLTPSTRNSVFDFINRIPAESGTNVYDALEKAFTYAGAGLQDKTVKASVDTIFLMTDGTPTAGQIQSTTDILRRIKETNKLKKIIVHTVGIFTTMGGASNQPQEAERGTEFLSRLAADHGGVFSDGKKKPK